MNSASVEESFAGSVADVRTGIRLMETRRSLDSGGVRRLDALLEHVTALVQVGTIRELYNALIEMMQSQMFGATEALVLEGDSDSDLLFSVAASCEELLNRKWTLSERFNRVRRGQIVALKDARGSGEWSGPLSELDDGARAVLHIPVRSTTILVALHPERGFFDREKVMMAGRMVPVMAGVVSRLVRHHHQLQHLRIDGDRQVRREQFVFIKQAARALGAGAAVLDTQGGLGEASDALGELVIEWGGAQEWWTHARGVLSQTPITGAEAIGAEGDETEERRIAKRTVDMVEPSGRRRIFELTFTGQAYRLDDGSVGHVVLVSDVSRWIKAEESLKEARDEAESANLAKSRFLANMSHELRTPLNAIIGYSEMVMEDAEDLGVQEFEGDLDKIHSSALQLLNLINDVLDLSKIEAGKIEMHYTDFDLVALLEEVEHTVHPMVEKNANAFVRDLTDLPGAMTSDREKVRQVLLNLLSNAAKFTEGGEVTLHASGMDRDGREGVCIKVRDTGIGIAQDKLNRLFKAFEQVDASATRQYGGTGLGLAISKRFCEKLGGDITVTSDVGEGSTFTIWLPEIAPEARDARAT